MGTRLVSVKPGARGTTAMDTNMVTAPDVFCLVRLIATLTEQPGLTVTQCTGHVTSTSVAAYNRARVGQGWRNLQAYFTQKP